MSAVRTRPGSGNLPVSTSSTPTRTNLAILNTKVGETILSPRATWVRPPSESGVPSRVDASGFFSGGSAQRVNASEFFSSGSAQRVDARSSSPVALPLA